MRCAYAAFTCTMHDAHARGAGTNQAKAEGKLDEKEDKKICEWRRRKNLRRVRN